VAGGDAELVDQMALRAVPAGLIGARLYHVVTDWRSYSGRWPDVIKVWEGGLGIPGGLVAGIVVALIYLRRQRVDWASFADAVVPAIPLAQAIGRLGTWFNQELYGRPTHLPWGLEIDPDHRPAAFAEVATFHPTFLYEALWNLGLVVILVVFDRRIRHAPGEVLWIYVAGYGLGRLWIESLRIDSASLVLGVRVNIFVALSAVIVGVAMAFRTRRRWRRARVSDRELSSF
jgi:prolipoprotein diacylglyceryl transferase